MYNHVHTRPSKAIFFNHHLIELGIVYVR